MSFFTALWARPAALSPLARFTIGCGVFYLVAGTGLLFVPESLAQLLFFTELDGWDIGLVHVVGMSLMVIGWFYVMGGRTGVDSFGLSTVVDRVLVPFALLGIWAVSSVPLMAVLPFAVLDPLLGLVALAIWQRTRE